MKVLEQLNHSLGLIASLAISAFIISACASATMPTPSKSQASTFYPEYYAAKQLSNQDIIKLREYMTDPNPFVSDSSTLLLGSYYLHYGDKNYGKRLIERSYNSKYFDEQMALFGEIYKTETLILENDRDGALTHADKILKLEKTPNYNRTMQIYCNQIGIQITSNLEINNCINLLLDGGFLAMNRNKKERISPSTGEIISSENMTYEEYVNAISGAGAAAAGTAMGEASQGDNPEEQVEANETNNENNFDHNFKINPNTKINITDGDLFDDLSQGMVFAMGQFGTNYQIEPISSFVAEKQDSSSILIRLSSLDIIMGGKEQTNLNVDMLGMCELIPNLALLKNKKNIIIIASPAYLEYAKLIEEMVYEHNTRYPTDRKGVSVITKNSNYQKELSGRLSGIENGAADKLPYYSIILLGSEKDIIDMIPIAKYWHKSKINQNIITVFPILPELANYPDQMNYFKDTYILTAANIANSPLYNALKDDFVRFYGSGMTARHALGYDIISYLHSLAEDAVITPSIFLTNIREISGNFTLRDITLYYYNESGYLSDQQTFKSELKDSIIDEMPQQNGL